jgi:hypothetical protein
MGQPEHSPSDRVMPPRRLTERLKAAGESTPSSMAQRFAPDIQALSSDDLAFDGPIPEASITHISPPDSSRARANQALLAVLILVSLIPSTIIGVTFWLGMVRTPWSASLVGQESGPPKVQQASVASVPVPDTIQPKQYVERPSVALTALNALQAEAGKEVPFSIAINSANPLPPRTIITIHGQPKDTTFSAGASYGETGWALRPDEIGDLRLRLPKTVTGQTDLRIELVTADGAIIASAFTHVNVATDPNLLLVLRREDSDRINDLMVHGRKMVEVGYLAGARAYFRRAAEAGSGDAALALGDTYDPAFIDNIGAHGIKADVAQARAWYERARELGSEEAKARLEQLKNADAAQFTSVEGVPSDGRTAGPKGLAEGSP